MNKSVIRFWVASVIRMSNQAGDLVEDTLTLSPSTLTVVNGSITGTPVELMSLRAE